MRTEQVTVPGAGATPIAVHRWSRDGEPRAIVHVVHGLAEHAARYEPLARSLVGRGYAVFAHDQRGHGRSIRNPAEKGHFGDEEGWDRVLEDVEAVRRRARDAYPRARVCLLGHSMGSFVSQAFVAAHPDAYEALVLSGSTIGGGPLVAAGRVIARLERLRQGARGRSALIDAMAFGAFNRDFAPARTRFDWLSRDAAMVDAFVADPLCGFLCTNQLWVDLLDALARIGTPAALASFPRDLPIYVIAGSRDPASHATRGLVALLAAFRRAGLTNVTHEIFPGARHEVFNETNREEVFAKLAGWLDVHVARRALGRGLRRPPEQRPSPWKQAPGAAARPPRARSRRDVARI